MKLVRVKLLDLLEFWLNKSMSTEECEAECLKNCSCTAHANSDIIGKGNGCLIWFGDLIDIRGYSEENDNSGYSEENPSQDTYIRLHTSELSKCTYLLYNTPFSLPMYLGVTKYKPRYFWIFTKIKFHSRATQR